MSSFNEVITSFVEGTPKAEVVSKEKAKRVYKHHEMSLTERLTAMIEKGESKGARNAYTVIAVIMAIVIIGCLIYTVSSLPPFGDPSNPANNEVVKKYIMDGIADTGAINFVAGMILDYRAFDTLGESTVLFIAASAVIILLFRKKTSLEKKVADIEEKIYEDKHDVILRHGALILVPFTLIYGIYVILNGHLSPGGGFSGGTIIGAALILYNLAFGDKSTKKFFNFKVYKVITIVALSFYAISKTYSFYTGANHIHSIIPKGIPGNLISSGLILPLNICVGIVVACTMFGFYSLFDREEI
ncbi:MAG: hypothetical protein IKI71_01150 [Lachnospiraceae bacterium]|nr:hypothetical protein [Lachnospiraceae bacterium]